MVSGCFSKCGHVGSVRRGDEVVSVSAFALVVVLMMAGEDSFSGCVDEGN